MKLNIPSQSVIVFHNPRCGKSRSCLAFLEQKKVDYEIVKYLETPPTIEELTLIIKQLNINPIDLIRKKESIWKTEFANKNLSNQELIEAMVHHPILIERPIVIQNEKAILGRQIESLEDFIKN